MGEIIYISDILEAYEEYKQNNNQVLSQGTILGNARILWVRHPQYLSCNLYTQGL